MLHKAADVVSLLVKFRQWRWVVIGVLVFGVLTFEFAEHVLFSRKSILEPDFLRDVVFYGVMAFFAASYVTNRIERLSNAYDQSRTMYGNLENLLVQLSDAQDSQEVSIIFLQSLRSSIPISGAQLLIYNSQEASFYLAATWSSNGAELPQPLPQPGNANCSLNQATRTTTGFTLAPCICTEGLPEQSRFYRFCLPVELGNDRLVGVLYAYRTEDLQFNSEQQKLLASMASEVGRTLEQLLLRESLDQHPGSHTSVQRRIARDVHATLGHNLAYMRLKLAQIADEYRDGNNPAFDELIQLQHTANESYQQMRDLLVALTPEMTPNLRSTMTNYTQRVANRAGFSLDIQFSGEPRQLSAPVLQHIILILREALGNIEKHAQARHVDVSVVWGDDSLNIRITDDGRGFDSSQSPGDDHLGIRFMQERAREVNGNLTISSKINSGTQVSLWAPYQQENGEN